MIKNILVYLNSWNKTNSFGIPRHYQSTEWEIFLFQGVQKCLQGIGVLKNNCVSGSFCNHDRFPNLLFSVVFQQKVNRTHAGNEKPSSDIRKTGEAPDRPSSSLLYKRERKGLQRLFNGNTVTHLRTSLSLCLNHNEIHGRTLCKPVPFGSVFPGTLNQNASPLETGSHSLVVLDLIQSLVPSRGVWLQHW